MKNLGKERTDPVTASKYDLELYDSTDEDVIGELNYSAVETLGNICVHSKTLSDSQLSQMFYASEYV
jgi:hypothetical protein